MASTPMFLSPTLLIIFCVLFLVNWPSHLTSRPTLKTQTGFRVPHTHVDFGKNLTKDQLLQRALERGEQRLDQIIKAMASVNDPVSQLKSPLMQTNMHHGEYLMNLAIGTPPVQHSAIMDTGSNLIWTHCKPCKGCPKVTLFDPSKSLSFSNKSCNMFSVSDCEGYNNQADCKCKQNYEDGSWIEVVMGKETFTFGDQRFSDIMFGCGMENKGYSTYAGLVGMGRGEISLLSQLGQTKFSYCLASTFGESKASFLSIGSEESSKVKVQTIPLVKDASDSYYHISLEGITVGNTRLPIKMSEFVQTSGMIIDSGTIFTYLVTNAYNVVKSAFLNQIKLQVSNDSRQKHPDLCFTLLPGEMNDLMIPKLLFHFEGVDLELPKKNYMYEDKRVSCLAILESENNVSIFGSMLQQNMKVAYDLRKDTVSFAPAKCDEI